MGQALLRVAAPAEVSSLILVRQTLFCKSVSFVSTARGRKAGVLTIQPKLTAANPRTKLGVTSRCLGHQMPPLSPDGTTSTPSPQAPWVRKGSGEHSKRGSVEEMRVMGWDLSQLPQYWFV